MNNKKRLLIITIILSISSISVMAATGKFAGGIFEQALTTIMDLLGAQIRLPHPGGAGEPVPFWGVVTVFTMFMAIIIVVGKNIPPFKTAESKKPLVAFSIALSGIAIFAANTVETVISLIGAWAVISAIILFAVMIVMTWRQVGIAGATVGTQYNEALKDYTIKKNELKDEEQKFEIAKKKRMDEAKALGLSGGAKTSYIPNAMKELQKLQFIPTKDVETQLVHQLDTIITYVPYLQYAQGADGQALVNTTLRCLGTILANVQHGTIKGKDTKKIYQDYNHEMNTIAAMAKNDYIKNRIINIINTAPANPDSSLWKTEIENWAKQYQTIAATGDIIPINDNKGTTVNVDLRKVVAEVSKTFEEVRKQQVIIKNTIDGEDALKIKFATFIGEAITKLKQTPPDIVDSSQYLTQAKAFILFEYDKLKKEELQVSAYQTRIITQLQRYKDEKEARTFLTTICKA